MFIFGFISGLSVSFILIIIYLIVKFVNKKKQEKLKKLETNMLEEILYTQPEIKWIDLFTPQLTYQNALKLYLTYEKLYRKSNIDIN